MKKKQIKKCVKERTFMTGRVYCDKMPYGVVEPARENGKGVAEGLELFQCHALHTIGRHHQRRPLGHHREEVDEHQASGDPILHSQGSEG